MKTHKNLYEEIISEENLYLAFQKAKKGKIKKNYVKEFFKNFKKNLNKLELELSNESYKPLPLETFTIRDPKTRKISKSDFRDRIVHHALCNIIDPIFDKSFIFDSYANRKGKGSLAALKRFDQFKRKISRNGKQNGWFNKNQVKGYVLKADIKHYFQTVNHKILLNIIQKKIKCSKTINLIKNILSNYGGAISQIGMPLGNLTSQFFANIYLNELDKFVKHNLKAKYYIRYVDDFVILSSSKDELIKLRLNIDQFLQDNLKIELHKDKTKIINLSKGVPFVGFRCFYHNKLLKKFNRRNIQRKLNEFHNMFLKGEIDFDKIYEKLQGYFVYMSHADTYQLKKVLANQFEEKFPAQISYIEVNRLLKDFKIKK